MATSAAVVGTTGSVTSPTRVTGRDVADYRAELRGHTRVLSALRETQLEHYGEHKADTAEIKAGLTDIARLLEGLSGRPATN